MHKLLEKLDKELHKYADMEGELKPEQWKCVYDAIEARKDLLTSMAMEGEDQYGNYSNPEEMSSMRSYRGGSSGRYYYPMMDPNVSYSYRGGRRSGMNNNGGNNGSSMRRTYSGNYSGNDGRDQMLDNLYRALDEASSDKEYQDIQNLINKLEQSH